MAKLTRIQLNFIKKMGLKIEDTLDATGLRTSEYKSEMQKKGKSIAYGVSACKKAGHTLKGRHGHCVQCHPQGLSHQRRYTESGDVYVAWSENGGFAKIGTAKNAYSRLSTLKKHKYGGQKDWTLELIYECTEAGTLENNVHKLLKKYELTGVLYRRELQTECTELFKCTLRQAKGALEKAVKIL